MHTTVIFAELLIIGVQAAVWVILLIIAFFGTGWIQDVKSAIEGIEVLSTITILALLYTFGIIVDTISIVVFFVLRPQKFVESLNLMKRRYEKDDLRITALCEESRAFTYFEYVRSRIRVMRGTAINFCAISIALMFSGSDIFKSSLSTLTVITLIILCLMLTVISVIAVGQMEASHDRRLEQMILRGKPEEKLGSGKKTGQARK